MKEAQMWSSTVGLPELQMTADTDCTLHRTCCNFALLALLCTMLMTPAKQAAADLETPIEAPFDVTSMT